MNNEYANLSLTRSHQALQGGEKYKVKKLDFDTSCECNITACDGGTIKVCGPIHFYPVPWPPHPPFDPCNYGQDIRADHFIAKTDYKLAYSTSTCAGDVAPTAVLGYFADLTVPAAPVLSTVLANEAGVAGGGYITINGTGNQPAVNPNNIGVQINGGSLPNTNDILITAGGASAGNITVQADSTGGQLTLNCDDNYNLNSLSASGLVAAQTLLKLLCRGGPVEILSQVDKVEATANTDVDITAVTGDINLGSTAGNH